MSRRTINSLYVGLVIVVVTPRWTAAAHVTRIPRLSVSMPSFLFGRWNGMGWDGGGLCSWRCGGPGGSLCASGAGMPAGTDSSTIP